MTGGEEAAPRRGRAPLRQRSRRRWAIAGGVAAGWLVLEVMTGSAVSATLVLVAIAALAGASLAGLRALGITRDHPWLQRMASRPWRDGQDVLRIAMRHLPDVFVITPSGSLLAPTVVELQLNPADLDSLREQMDLDVISSSLTEVYEEQVVACQARPAAPGRAQVYVIASGSVPPGRYRLRQGDPVRAGTRPDRLDVPYAHAAAELANAAPRRAYARPRQPCLAGPGPDGGSRRDRGRGRDHGDGTERALRPGAAAGHRLLGSGNPDVGRPGRARAGGADAARRAHGVQGARAIHVRRTAAGGSRTRAGTGSPSTVPR